MADDANRAGRTRLTQREVAVVVELSRRQTERHFAKLRALRVIVREGRTWRIRGVADHDITSCEHEWCVREQRRKCRPTVRRPRHGASAGPAVPPGDDAPASPPRQRGPALATTILDTPGADATPAPGRGRFVRSRRGTKYKHRRARPP
jgi:hypothetical protein